MRHRTHRRRYEVLAGPIALLPNVRRRDSLFQGVCVVLFTLLGAAIGGALKGVPTGAAAGLVGGLVFGLLLSGLFLVVVGLLRKR